MKTLKTMTVAATLAAFFVAAAMVSASRAATEQFDAGATYTTKCVACHGPKAAKKFDAAKADAEHVQVVLKGKKGEKPPNMPGYEDKGVTEDQAKALVAYMRSIL